MIARWRTPSSRSFRKTHSEPEESENGQQEEEEEDNTPETLEAVLYDVPATHPGSGSITFRISFNQEPHELGYMKLRNETLIAELGGRRIHPMRAYKLDPSSARRWEVIIPVMESSSVYNDVAHEDFTLEIKPTENCDDAGAVCTEEGLKMSNHVSARVKGPANTSVTASFSGMPEVHRGDAFDFQLSFNAAFPVDAETLLSAFSLTGGSVSAASEVEEGDSQHWNITVQPTQGWQQAMTITLSAKESCEAEGALCNAAGRHSLGGG